MKKTLLAIAIPTLIFATNVSATEIYTDELNSLSIGGHISGGLIGSDEADTDVNSVSPRINFGVTRALGNGFTADALAEWSINTEGGEQALSTRLGYAGLTHDTYGRAIIGTQWAPTYDVTGVTDLPIAFANDFLYNSDMGKMGTGRADDMVSYRNGFEFGENMALNLGLGWQASNDLEADGTDSFSKRSYDSRYQAALSFDFSDFTVGAAYNTGDVTFSGKTESSTATNISVKYGAYGQGFYAAAVYGDNENVIRSGDNYSESQDVEAIIAYAFENSLNVSLNYEAADGKLLDNSSSKTIYSQTALQVEYNFAPSVVGYAGYQIDLGSDLVGHKDDNIWMFGGRVYF